MFFHRQGEFRDRIFENQSFRASGLSLLTAAIVHCNTISLDQAVRQLRAQGVTIPGELLAYVAPLGWEHIALTGDYDWNTARPANGLRPLRAVPEAFTLRAAERAVLSKRSGEPYTRGAGSADRSRPLSLLTQCSRSNLNGLDQRSRIAKRVCGARRGMPIRLP